MLQASYGSDVRRAFDFEHGGTHAGALNWYLAGTLFAEDGWRDDSPSDVRQIFGKVGWERSRGSLALTLAHARNDLNGNALQEIRLLDRDAASVYTKPDETHNRATFVNAALRHAGPAGLAVSGNVYYRDIDTRTFNGDVNEDSLDQSLYQPSPAERAALIAAGTPTCRPRAPTPRTRRFRIGAVSATCCSTTSRPRSATGCRTARDRRSTMRASRAR